MKGWLLLFCALPALGWAQTDGGEAPAAAEASPPAEPLAPDAGTALPLEEEPATMETVVKHKVLDIGRVAGSAHVFTKSDLERHEYDDVQRLLAPVPGVYLRTEDGYGLRPNIGLRGASSDRSSKVTLMEDQVLFAPAPYSAPAAYFFPLLTRMEGAELYKGPASIRFGPHTIGGAFNVRSRSLPLSFEAEMDVALGAYRGAKAHGYAGYGNERWGVLLEGVHLGSGGFKQLDGGGSTGFDKNEVMAKAGWRGTAGEGKQSLQLKLSYADEVSDETYLGLSEEDFAQSPLRRYAASQQDRMTWSRWGAALNHRLEWGPVELESTAYWQTFQRVWRKLNGFRRGPDLRQLLGSSGSGQNAVWMAVLRGEEDSATEDQALVLGTNDRRYLSQGVQLAARHRWSLGEFEQRTEAGARFHHDQAIRHHTEDGYAMVRGTLVPDGSATLDTTEAMGFARAWAFYAQSELSYGGWLLVPGARVELIRTGSADHVRHSASGASDLVLLPGLGVVRQLGRHFSLLAGAHQGFSPVSPGQPDEVHPEKSWNYEGGVRFRSRPVKAELIGFFNDYFNITGECTLSSGCDENLLNRQYNGGAAQVYGLEASASARLPTWAGIEAHLDGSYTFTLTEFLTTFQSEAPQFGYVRAGDELPYVPRHLATLGLRAAREAWSASLRASYVGEMREVAGSGPIPQAELAQANLVLDLAVHRQLGEASQLYLTINNLTNSTYLAAHRPYGARPGAPLNGFLGFKHRF